MMINDEIVSKKRRNVRRFGCVREMNRGFCDVKLRREKSRDFSCKDAMMVAYLAWVLDAVFRAGLRKGF